MISTTLSILILFVLLVSGTCATDYCRKGLCRGKTHHIGCNNQMKFAASCQSPKLVDFTTTLQHLILDTHNRYRNEVASGRTKLAPAVSMPMLKWNSELAKLAEYNVRLCKMAHDQCRNTHQFPWVGQNLGMRGTKGTISPMEILSHINLIMDSWFYKIKDVNQNWIDKFPLYTGDRAIAHFTEMVQDRTTDIGCAAATYKSTFFGSTVFNITSLLMACNYSFTNLVGATVYVKGPEGSKCTSGRDSKFNSLCSAMLK